ncbi:MULTISPECIES: hypothetical protein [Natrialbaceae]|uniref:hypothetical protein n=1 Tax=Natrialbaceae TaxID=1644061 RepID=UPI00207C8910|nr:hypothetical protein [Natronococcus sp. CG52]
MRRRELLVRTAGGFGGIVTFGSGGAGGASISRSPDEPDARDRLIERRDQRCVGDEEDEATIRFADECVVVEGLIRTPTPCHPLELEDASFDPADDALVVRVGVGRPDETICVQCLGIVEYEARIGLDGRSPDRVEVVHERPDETVDVATADR